MSDEDLTPSSLQKRHRNLMVFSVAVMIIGWAPNEMQSTFSFLTIKFEKIDPDYMWSWALVINAYLFLAWIYTSRADDQWLYLRGEKLKILVRNKDFFWLRFFVCRKYARHSFKKEIFEMVGDGNYISKYVKTYEMVTCNNQLYNRMHRSEHKQVLISKSEFETDFHFSRRRLGRNVCLYEGRHLRKPFYLMAELHLGGRKNPRLTVRQVLAELYFSILPALIVGFVGVGTAAANLFTAT